MVIKVIRVEWGYIVQYASGRTRLIYDNRKIPKTIKLFMEHHPPTIEKYRDVVNATIWK